MHNRILVTGATGNVGRHVVTGLLASGVLVRALTRHPESAGLPREVEVVQGDLSDPSAFAHHLKDPVDAVFLLSRGLPAPGLIETIAAHTRRVVFLSSSAIRDDVEQQTNWIARIHAEIESAIRQSGIEWTFLRPGAFASNSLRWWGPQIRAGNVVRWPYASAQIAPIDECDIAAVAVRALTEPGHGGRTYTLMGPQSLTQAEQVRIIGEAIGRPLEFEEIPDNDARKEMSTLMPPQIVDLLLAAWANATGPAATTPTSTHTFRDWANAHAEDFRSTEAGRTLPDIKRPDVAFAGVSESVVDTPERQQAMIDALVAAARTAPWPRGLLQSSLYASLDGTAVLNYAQWASDEDFEKFAQTQLKSLIAAVDRAVPNIMRKPEVRYRLYRGNRRDSATTVPGCIVFVSVEFDAPDEQRQRQWIDTVFEALEAESALPEGGLSGYFHVSVDGTRVLNYAEWTTEEAHRDALERSGQGTIGPGAKWLDVRNFPGVVSNGFKRYRLAQSLTEKKG